MALLPDSPTNLYITFGLNNIVARETRVEVRTPIFHPRKPSFLYISLFNDIKR